MYELYLTIDHVHRVEATMFSSSKEDKETVICLTIRGNSLPELMTLMEKQLKIYKKGRDD